jgi:GNAT superfamily N-acetyltransferase
MADQVRIERVTVASFDGLIAMLGGLAATADEPALDATKTANLRRDLLGDDPRFEAHLAMLGDEVIGGVTLDVRYSTFRAERLLFMGELYVVEEHQRNGIGQALFQFAQRRTQELGCGLLQWNAYGWNAQGRGFYDKNGAFEWGADLVWFGIRPQEGIAQ